MNISAKAFRRAMPVREAYLFRGSGVYPVCPRCQLTFEREYQRFCDRCGQRLSWSHYSKTVVVRRL